MTRKTTVRKSTVRHTRQFRKAVRRHFDGVLLVAALLCILTTLLTTHGPEPATRIAGMHGMAARVAQEVRVPVPVLVRVREGIIDESAQEDVWIVPVAAHEPE